MSEITPRITGFGYAVPSHVRTNDDPVFDWLKQNHPEGVDLFTGYKDRRVLSEGEDLMTIMVPAAQQALANAGLSAQDVDLLLGTGSVSPYKNPNALSQLHQKLGLPAAVWVIPVECDFSNYNASLWMADALIRAGRACNVLICVGGNWTRNVDYHTPQAVSAADGAGAVVMGASDDPAKWTVVDQLTITDTTFYGSMYTDGDLLQVSPPQSGHDQLWTSPFFHITADGIKGFKEFGAQTTPLAGKELLQRHGLTGADVTLISHQASTVLMDAWEQVIQPAQYIRTIASFANMAPANVPVTLAWAEQNQPVEKDHLLLLSIGPDMHANALLLRRQ